MRETGLTLLEVKEDGFSLRMERPGAGQSTEEAHTVAEHAPVPVTRPQQAGGDTYTVSSPMVGVFYASPAPDMKPYVSIGDTVQAGDVLCVIEAMKMMNEITAEKSGVVTEICAGNKQIVEYGHPLFHLRIVPPAAQSPEG
jgi:acetyl-CoA carboxylase biotin carboxyl carrier protein